MYNPQANLEDGGIILSKKGSTLFYLRSGGTNIPTL